MTDPAAHPPLRLTVPAPEVRPGGQPDFSHVAIPPAGSVRRPEVDADPESLRDLAFTIIRVLNRQGEAPCLPVPRKAPAPASARVRPGGRPEDRPFPSGLDRMG